MKAKELIERLQHLVKEHGDQDVFLDVTSDGLIEIGEVDVDTEDTGIIVWPAGGDA